MTSEGTYREILNTDQDIYGGSNQLNPKALKSERVPCLKEKYSVVMDLGAFASAVFVLERPQPKKETTKKTEKETANKKR